MTLLVVPPLRVHHIGCGHYILTRKFLEGMLEYARFWPGEVHVLAEPSDTLDDNLDHVKVEPCELPFRLHLHSLDDKHAVRECIKRSRLVLATLDYRQINLWKIAKSVCVPVAYVSECSLRTRKQIICHQVKNPIRRLRRSLREPGTERRFREAVRNTAGVQCNGTPTFEAYHLISPRPLLYFDTRVGAELIASTHDLSARLGELRDGCPLRLAFSGRLISIKGADHLPRVACELRKLGVRFTFDIFGGGDQEPQLRREVARQNLAELIQFRGVVDFQKQLVPAITHEIDLFVCCHRQGDPSCTYLETMSCGVPIVGYDNEALAGLVKHSQVGWVVAMDDPRVLANKINELDRNREVLAEAAYHAREFSLKHSFQETMRRRVEHMLECAEKLELTSKAR